MNKKISRLKDQSMRVYFLCAALSVLPIFLYNGKRGRGLKWLFYVFYPGHLLLIWLLRTVLAA